METAFDCKRKLLESYIESGRKNGDLENEIIIEYRYLVSNVVRQLQKKLPRNVFEDDLTSWGLEGLFRGIKLIDFDKLGSHKPEWYLYYSVRGSIFNVLRDLDILPLEQRRKCKLVDRLTEEFYSINGRNPIREELLELVGITDYEYSRYFRFIHSKLVPFSASFNFNGHDDNYCGESELEWNKERQQDQFAEDRDLVLHAMKTLSFSESAAIHLLYHCGLSRSEVAEKMKVSKNWISQLHREAIRKMRKCLILTL